MHMQLPLITYISTNSWEACSAYGTYEFLEHINMLKLHIMNTKTDS